MTFFNLFGNTLANTLYKLLPNDIGLKYARPLGLSFFGIRAIKALLMPFDNFIKWFN